MASRDFQNLELCLQVGSLLDRLPNVITKSCFISWLMGKTS